MLSHKRNQFILIFFPRPEPPSRHGMGEAVESPENVVSGASISE